MNQSLEVIQTNKKRSEDWEETSRQRVESGTRGIETKTEHWEENKSATNRARPWQVLSMIYPFSSCISIHWWSWSWVKWYRIGKLTVRKTNDKAILRVCKFSKTQPRVVAKKATPIAFGDNRTHDRTNEAGSVSWVPVYIRMVVMPVNVHMVY